MVHHGYHHRDLQSASLPPDPLHRWEDRFMIFNNMTILIPAILCINRYYWFEALFFIAVGIASTLYHICWATAWTDEWISSRWQRHQFEECVLEDYTILLGLDMVLSCNAISLTIFHILFRSEIMVMVCTMSSVTLSVLFQHCIPPGGASSMFAFAGVGIIVVVLVATLHQARVIRKVLTPTKWKHAILMIIRDRVAYPRLFWWGLFTAVAGAGFLVWDLAGWDTVYSYPHAIWHLLIMVSPFLCFLSTKPKHGSMCCGKSRRRVQDEQGLNWCGDPKVLWAVRSAKSNPSVKPMTLPTHVAS